MHLSKQIRSDYWHRAGQVLLFLTLVWLLAGLGGAQAQDPVSTIEDATGENVLQLFENGDLELFQNGALTVPGTIESTSGGIELPDGTKLEGAGDLGGVPTTSSGAFDLTNDEGILASGTFDTGTIPAEGAGTRMLWYPAKAAFRAGRVGVGPTKGDVWDADSVGSGSMAFGVDTKANGTDATAMGYRTTASGLTATAMGETTTASADHGTAMGSLTTASGEIATAMGSKTTAEGPVTLATGIETTASGFVATAMGNQTIASGYAATAMGRKTTAATDQSLSIGQCNSANQSEDATLLVIGNGTYSGGNVSGVCDDRSDALVLDESGNLTISGTLTENSDRRLKTQIEPLGSGTLQKLGELRPVRFEFRNQKTHPSGTQVGLIAQDVRKEFPALVSKGSGGYLSLAYPKMAAVLLKGIQEQQTTVEQQRARIESLKARVDRLERLRKRVAKLESRSGASLLAGLPGSGLLLGLLLGGLFSAALLWRRRN